MSSLNQHQTDLFNDSTPIKKRRSVWRSRKNQLPLKPREMIYITREQLVLVLCVLIVALCVSYMVGVNRGRGESAKLIAQPIATHEEIPSAPAASDQAETMVSIPTQETATRMPVSGSQTPAEGIYTVQVVTYRSTRRAEREIALLENRGLTAFTIPSGDYFQVCVGSYPTHAAAQEVLLVVQKNYTDAFIRRK